LLDKAWVRLTNLYYHLENYEKAAHYIAKALKIDDDNALYWKYYANINLKLNFFEEAVNGFYNCLKLDEKSIEVYIGLIDVLTFLGEFNDALKYLIEARKSYANFAEIEYRLAGLFFVLNKEKYAKNHLINGLKIDYSYHHILNELFPVVLNNKKIQKLIINFKKAIE